MFLYVVSEEERNELIKLGYKYMNQEKVGKNTVYIFNENKKLKFNEKKIKVFKTNRLNFG